MGNTVRRKRHLREAPSDDLVNILSDVPWQQHENPFSRFAIGYDELEAGWRKYGDTIVRDWIRHSPGTRPSHWWAFESREPRRQLGGEGSASGSGFAFGLPYSWNGGEPVFETQHEYLKRLGLLLPGEAPPIREPHPVPGGHESGQGYSSNSIGGQRRR